MIVSLNTYVAGLALCAAAWITSSVLAADQPAEQLGSPTATEAAAAPPMIRSQWDIMLELAIRGEDPAPGTLAAVLGSASSVVEKFGKLVPQVQNGDAKLLTEHSRNLPDSAPGRTWLARQQKLCQEHWYQQLVDMYFADDKLAMAFVMFVPRPTQEPKVVEPLFLIRQDDHWRVSLDIDGEVASQLGAQGQQQLVALRAVGEMRLTELRDVVSRPLEARLPFRGTWTTHFRQSGLFLCFDGDGQVTTIVTHAGSTRYSVFDYHLSHDQIVIESQLGPIRLRIHRDQFWEHDGQRFYSLTIADPRIWFPDAPKEILYLQPVHHGDWPVRRPVQNAQPKGEPNGHESHTGPDSDLLRLEYRREVFRWAVRQVRQEFQQATWEAFWLTAVEGRAVEVVAEELGKNRGAIHAARSRVIRRIQEKVTEYEQETQT